MGLAIQTSFFDDTLAEWSPPQDFPELNGKIAIDLEYYDPHLKTHGPGWFCNSGNRMRDGFVTGISLAGPDWQNYYPIHHSGGNLDEEVVLRWLRAQAAKPNITWRWFNRMSDQGWLQYRYGIKFAGKHFDSLTASPLIDENRFSYQLDALLRDWCPNTRKAKGSLAEAGKMANVSDPKSVMHLLPAPFVGPYAEQDARGHYDLAEECERRLSAEDLWDIYDLESRLIPVLLEMRHHGCPVNVIQAEQVGKDLARKIKEQLDEIHRLTEYRISETEVMNANAIAKVFDKLGIKYSMTAGGKLPSITKNLLDHLDHPIGGLLRAARKYALAKGTFIDGHVLGHAVNGKIHCQFHPLRRNDEEGSGGAITGRFSSSNPNLQNLPARDPDNPLKDEIGELIRGLFMPWEGESWAAIDYSGQEPRLATHFAALARISGVERFIKAYQENPGMKFHKKSQEFTGLGYKEAKNMMLGKMYGMGGAKMCRQLGLPTEWREGKDGRKYEVAGPDGQSIFNKFDEHIPWVKALADLAMRRAEHRGWIRTLCGRRRRFEPIYPRGAYSYKALNCLIQGSAADQMKKAMVDLYESEGIVPLVTVHDELGISVPNRETAERYKQIMLDSVTLAVPNAADLEYGPNWGDAE